MYVCMCEVKKQFVQLLPFLIKTVKLSMAAYTYNFNSQEDKAGGSPVQGQPWLYRKNLPKNNNKKTKQVV